MDEQARLAKLEQFKENLGYYSLHISRVPKSTYESFKQMADKEFCSDFGFCLKHLIDCYQGLITTGVEHLEMEISALRTEFEALKAQSEKKEEPKAIRSLNGRVIR